MDLNTASELATKLNQEGPDRHSVEPIDVMNPDSGYRVVARDARTYQDREVAR